MSDAFQLAFLAAATPDGATRSPSVAVLAVAACLGAGLVLAWARFVRTPHLAIGFAATASLWALGYLAMMQPGLVAGDVLFGVMLLVLFAAGWVAGRFGDSTVRPLSVGLVSATANLLVLGAFLRDEQHGSRVTPVAWILGLYVVSGLLAWIGGLAGRAMRPLDGGPSLPRSAATFGFVAAGTVFLLLITGGLVTGLESGLAVPDWPNSFGHNMLLYPVSEMKGGIYYEHAHRLYGMLVGTTALILVSVVWREETRPWLRWLVIALLAMVCFQGLLGGLRVTGRLTMTQDRQHLAPSIALAITHGVFAQIVFATFLVVSTVTTKAWTSTRDRIGVVGAEFDRGLALALPVVVLVQLILGAIYRHLQPVDAVGPLAPGHPLWAIYAHIGGAVVVTGVVSVAAGRAWAYGVHPILRSLGKILFVALGCQLLLGIVSLVAIWTRSSTQIPAWEVVVTTAHQATGAFILGVSTLLAVWTRRLLAEETVTRVAMAD